MIFRRENRGESFQRQISNLRQQQPQSEDPSEDDEQQHDYESYEYEAEDPDNTNPFAAEQGAPEEGLAFPPPSSEPAPEEQSPQTTSISPPPSPQPSSQDYQGTRQWEAPAPAAPQTPAAPTGDASTSTIAKNAYWNGTLKSESSLHVFGRADGELHSDTDLYVAEGAEVDASLHAENVVVAGLVRGKIEARARLEVLPQGEVTGDVRSPKLVVHEGATISGQLKMEEVGSGSSAAPRPGGSES